MELQIPPIPQPEYALVRYNSATLLCWLERCELTKAIAMLKYHELRMVGEPALVEYGKSSEASVMAKEIREVLLSRNYTPGYLRNIELLIMEDVNSGN